MGSFFKTFSLTYALWWSMTCAGESPCWKSPIKWAFILSNNCEPKVCQYPTTTLPWQTSLCLFLCSGLRYINWDKLGSRYGCFAMKNRWQLRLVDIMAIVSEILVLIFAPWLDSGNSNKTFFAFLLLNVSFCLWCFHLCCVDNNNFCMSCGIILVLFSGPKLQLNMKNMDMRCEVRTQRLWTIFKNYGQEWVGMYVIC